MIALDLTPAEEAQIVKVAQQTGLAPSDYVKKVLQEHLPDLQNPKPPVSEKKKSAIALLESWIAASPADPEEIRQSEAELNEFLQNLNRNRLESGESPLFP